MEQQNEVATGPETTRGKAPMRRAFDRALLMALAVGIVAALKALVVDVGVVEGDSMRPTLVPDDRVLVEKVSPRLGRLHRGDIVMVRWPDGDGLVVKRLIALPGDRVATAGGHVLVNGHVADSQQCASLPLSYAFPAQRLRAGEVFLLGDNRLASEDSATWGPLGEATIVARVISRPWRWRGPVASLPRLLAPTHAAQPAG